MKIWEMNDCDWWMSEGREEAIEGYRQLTGMPRDEITEGGYPVELSADQLDSQKYTREDDATGKKEVVTFREQMESRLALGITNEFFASTEY